MKPATIFSGWTRSKRSSVPVDVAKTAISECHDLQSELNRLRDKHEALKRQYASSARRGMLESRHESNGVTSTAAGSEVVDLRRQLQQARAKELNLLVQLTGAKEKDRARWASIAESAGGVEKRKTRAKEAEDQAAGAARKLTTAEQDSVRAAKAFQAIEKEVLLLQRNLIVAERDSLDSAVALRTMDKEMLLLRRKLDDCQREAAARSDRFASELEQKRVQAEQRLAAMKHKNIEQAKVLQTEVTALKQEREDQTRLRNEMDWLRAQKRNAELTLEKVQRDNGELEVQVYSLKRGTDVLLAAQKLLQDEGNQRDGERAQSQAELMESRRMNSLAIADLRLVREERDHFQTSVQSANHEHESLRAQHEDLKLKLVQMVSEWETSVVKDWEVGGFNFRSWVDERLGSGIIPQEVTCTICTTEYPAADLPSRPSDSECSHPSQTCTECWKQWLDSQMETKTWNTITCPQCPVVLNQSAMRVYATAATYSRYLDAELRSTLSADPDFRWCTAPECSSGQIHGSGDVFYCAECGSTSCVTCSVPWHAGETCDAFQARVKRQPEEEEASEAAVKTLAKLCPGCDRRIQKNGGCDHMTCQVCRAEFCWVCLADYKDIRTVGNTAHARTCGYHA